MSIQTKHYERLNDFSKESEEVRKVELKIRAKKAEIEKCNDWMKKNRLCSELEDLEKQNVSRDNQNDYLLDVASLTAPNLKEVDMEQDMKSDQSNISGFFGKMSVNNKKQIYDTYMSKFENQQIQPKLHHNYVCDVCKVSKIIVQSESTITCPRCGLSETFLDSSAQGMTYEQEINSEINVSFSYKRINHYNEFWEVWVHEYILLFYWYKLQLLITGSYL
mgnify:CR=1 FL=1